MAEEKKVSAEEKMEELHKELRGYMAQIEALRAEIALINQSIADLRAAAATLRNLKDLGKGKNILIPIGSTAQIEAKIEDVDKVVMSVGAGISAVLSYEEALKRIEVEIAALEALRRSLEEAIVELYNKTEELLERVREVGKQEASA
ncbi:MAG: prefoldin subunit alpha [Aquificae bacterium]|nr:prefoldin subunit alpha [Aquificota bacterium]